MKFYNIIQFIFNVILTIQLFQSVESAGFGLPCRPSSPIEDSDYQNGIETFAEFDSKPVDDYCDFGEGACIDQKCQCRVPSMMTYSKRLEVCGAPVGSYCDQNITCLTGAECGSDNICICPDPFEVVADGGCSSYRHDPCLEDSDCSTEDFLGCYEGRCDCKSTRRTIYQHNRHNSWTGDEAFEGGCRIRVGEVCLPMEAQEMGPIQPCAMNAECNMPINASGSIPISEFPRTDLSMMMGQCLCQAGHTPTPDGTCRKDYGTSCTAKLEECNSNAGLMCKDNTCVCIDDDTMYDKVQRACVSFAGESCGEFPLWYESYDIGCVQNAECVLDPGRMVLGVDSSIGRTGKLRSCMEEEGRTCVSSSNLS